MYATPANLNDYLQATVPVATATLALEKASAVFSTRAGVWWAPQTVTYTATALGYRQLFLPFRPVTAVSAVRVNGTVVASTSYRLIRSVLYSSTGFGAPLAFPPDLLEVDLTHGYTTPTDDVVGVVLEMAAAAVNSPDLSVVQEQIDDYSVKTSTTLGGFTLTPSAQVLADWYRGTLAA